MTVLGILGPMELLLILTVILFPVIALIDIAKSRFNGNEKIMWIIIVLFSNFLGSIIYFIVGRKQKII